MTAEAPDDEPRAARAARDVPGGTDDGEGMGAVVWMALAMLFVLTLLAACLLVNAL
jgi:hypothetical protein